MWLMWAEAQAQAQAQAKAVDRKILSPCCAPRKDT
jgi:hypothetical protein